MQIHADPQLHIQDLSYNIVFNDFSLIFFFKRLPKAIELEIRKSFGVLMIKK